MYQLPIIDVEKEKKKIISFLKQTLKEQNKKQVVLGMSGGIDSATCFYLLKETIPPENILIAHLYYFQSKLKDFQDSLEKAQVPSKNIHELSIKNAVDELAKTLFPTSEVELRPRHTSEVNRIRLGNIMARIRMIMLYDFAKKNDALVLGTEDKSEFLLGYYTRFGDQASDIEPIRHLYKTQVYQLAKYLNVPEEIINQRSSPDLWLGHTAEKELGFSYAEADIVLHLCIDKKIPIEEIKKMNLPNAEKIINWVRKNSFKRHLPYAVK